MDALSNNDVYKISAHAPSYLQYDPNILISSSLTEVLSDEFTSCIIDMGSREDYQCGLLHGVPYLYRYYMDYNDDHPDVVVLSMQALLKILGRFAYHNKLLALRYSPLRGGDALLSMIDTDTQATVAYKKLLSLIGPKETMFFFASILEIAYNQYDIPFPFGNNFIGLN